MSKFDHYFAMYIYNFFKVHNDGTEATLMILSGTVPISYMNAKVRLYKVIVNSMFNYMYD